MATLPNRPEPFRRRLLLAAATAGLARQAAAQPAPQPTKVSRETAHYQDTPRDGMSCEACSFFRRPASCQVVTGAVSPHGWCQLFDMPD